VRIGLSFQADDGPRTWMLHSWPGWALLHTFVLFFWVTHWFLDNDVLSFGSTHYFPFGRVGWALVDPIVTPLACLIISTKNYAKIEQTDWNIIHFYMRACVTGSLLPHYLPHVLQLTEMSINVVDYHQRWNYMCAWWMLLD
jgi:hypothetical protein